MRVSLLLAVVLAVLVAIAKSTSGRNVERSGTNLQFDNSEAVATRHERSPQDHEPGSPEFVKEKSKGKGKGSKNKGKGKGKGKEDKGKEDKGNNDKGKEDKGKEDKGKDDKEKDKAEE